MTTKKIIKLLAFVISLIMVFSFVGCGQNNTIISSDFELSVYKKTINIGDEFTISSNIKEVTYKSNNIEIATVNSNGKVKGISVGTTTIDVSYFGKIKSCEIVVNSNKEVCVPILYTGVGITSAYVGDVLKIKPQFYLGNKNLTGLININVESSNEQIAKIIDNNIEFLSEGKVDFTAKCSYKGEEIINTSSVSVTKLNEKHLYLCDNKSNIVKNNLTLVNKKSINQLLSVKYCSTDGIYNYNISSNSVKINNSFMYDILDNDEVVGNVVLKILDIHSNSVLNDNGEIKYTFIDSTTVKVNFTVEKIKINNYEGIDYNDKQLTCFLKDEYVYTDIIDLKETATLNQYFSYTFSDAGGSMSICDNVKYKSNPTIKLEIPVNYSYFNLMDLMNNADLYNLSKGTKISFMIRLDGEPKTASAYYAIWSAISVNGVEENQSLINYAQVNDIIIGEDTSWKKVTLTLTEDSFPLSILGLKIAGNSNAKKRYLYLANFTVENPETFDYTKNFASTVNWENTGYNKMYDWWGYAGNVSTIPSLEMLSEDLSNLYVNKFETDSFTKVLVCNPNINNQEEFVYLQNSSCVIDNTMKATITVKKCKTVRIRVYMKVDGELPKNDSVTSIIFFRNGTTTFGFGQNLLQGILPNKWSELTFTIPTDYYNATELTFAFNLKNYYGRGSINTITFYVERIYLK